MAKREPITEVSPAGASHIKSEAAPDGLTPDRLPDPWLVDSEQLLAELSRIRQLVLMVPCSLHTFAPINTVVDACWRLEQQLRYLLHLHREGQRSFAKRAQKRAAKPAVAPKIVKFA